MRKYSNLRVNLEHSTKCRAARILNRAMTNVRPNHSGVLTYIVCFIKLPAPLQSIRLVVSSTNIDSNFNLETLSARQAASITHQQKPQWVIIECYWCCLSAALSAPRRVFAMVIYQCANASGQYWPGDIYNCDASVGIFRPSLSLETCSEICLPVVSMRELETRMSGLKFRLC